MTDQAFPVAAALRVFRFARGGASVWLIWPAAMLACFFFVPFALLFRVSAANIDPAVYQGSGFSLTAYGALAQPMVLDALVFSIWLALIVASISTAVALPATYLICRMRRKAQIAWLIGFLSTLALSEVLITFSWQIMLSRRAGISNILVWLGILEKPISLYPSFSGVVACLVYVVIPFSVLTLYPGLSRLDPAYMEAARTLGARPMRAFVGILVPIMRKPVATAFVMCLVFAIGSYVTPLVLGGPENWTIGVVISETALAGQNLPLAAAISVLLLGVMAALIGLSGLVSRERRA
jgi:putative spermidine/putrescine transport system permease protein